MTKAFDLALFVGTPVNPGDGVVVNTIGPPLNTKFTPLATASAPGVIVGASVPAATGAGQTLVSGGTAGFPWAAAASSSSLPPATAQGQTFVSGPGPTYGWTVAIPAVPPAPTASTPLMDGTPSAGALGTYSRGDHVHPSDTSRYAATNPLGYQTAAQVTASIAASAYTLPTASTSVLGGVKVDGTTVTISGGVISASSSGGGIADAPNDSTAYARKNLAWSHITHADITDWAANISNPSALTPLVNGTAAIGSDAGWSRGDHVHPTDTTRYAASNPSGYQTAAQVNAVLPAAATATPLMNGAAAVGTGTTFARADHVHPVDTSRYAATNPSGYQTAAQVTASINAAAYTLPTASTSVLGGVMVDGTSITISAGKISAAGGGGGILDAANDGTTYARNSALWVHLSHNDITDWASTLSPYALTTSIPAASSAAPLINGTAAAGSATSWSRGDHVHPTDTTRAAVSALPAASGTNPVMDGSVAVGVSTNYARGDHVHPSDTSRAPVASPTFTGVVTIPSGASIAGYATTASVPVVTTTAPAMDGTATVGASGKWADGAHIHPTDTTRYAASNPSGYQTAANVTASLAPYALIASPTFTGVVTIPTGAAIATPNITGVTNASNAAAGQVGEWITASQLTAQSLTTATAINLTSISLTAGDWDVDGDVFYQASALSVSNFVCGVNLTSLAIPAVGTPGRAQMVGVANAFIQSSFSTGRLRVNVSTTTTVYLVVSATFGSGTCTAQGTIQARRMR